MNLSECQRVGVLPPFLIVNFSFLDVAYRMRQRYRELGLAADIQAPHEFLEFAEEPGTLSPAGIVAIGGYRKDALTPRIMRRILGYRNVPLLATGSAAHWLVEARDDYSEDGPDGPLVHPHPFRKGPVHLRLELYRPDTSDNPIAPVEPERLFEGLSEVEEVGWLEHAGRIPVEYQADRTGRLSTLPPTFLFLGETEDREVVAFRDARHPWYGLALHPEHDTMHEKKDGSRGPGMIILANFARMSYRRFLSSAAIDSAPVPHL